VRGLGAALRRLTGAGTVGVALLAFAAPQAQGALEPERVADVRPGGEGSSPGEFGTVGANLYFNARSDPAIGSELHRTDGTAAGTVLVRDILPGPPSGSPYGMTALGNIAIFGAQGAAADFELWRSDGTTAGTTRVLDINPGAGGSFPSEFTPLGNKLLFSAFEPVGGTEVWSTDGTSAGTARVANIGAGAAGSSPTQFTQMGNFLYFNAIGPGTGSELWRTDGTDAGTTQVADINPGAPSSNPQRFGVANGFLYFRAEDATGRELWRTDGVTTTQVANIAPGAAHSDPDDVVPVAGGAMFTANDGTNGRELWRTNGTPAGTTLVASIAPGPEGSNPHTLTPLGNRVVMAADDNSVTSNVEPWISDGTAAGTTKLKEGAASLNEGSGPDGFTQLGGVLYFEANDRHHGSEVWRTDGTPAGTRMLTDLNPDGNDASPFSFTAHAGTLFFVATDPLGSEPFKLAENPPDLTLSADDQRLAKQLRAEVACDEECTVTVDATVKAKLGKKKRKKTKTFKLRGALIDIEAGDTALATPSFRSKDFKKASKILRQGGKLKAALNASAKDYVDNVSTAKAKVKLK
jgi:ELWxxDGT repeat protein